MAFDISALCLLTHYCNITYNPKISPICHHLQFPITRVSFRMYVHVGGCPQRVSIILWMQIASHGLKSAKTVVISCYTIFFILYSFQFRHKYLAVWHQRVFLPRCTFWLSSYTFFRPALLLYLQDWDEHDGAIVWDDDHEPAGEHVGEHGARHVIVEGDIGDPQLVNWQPVQYKRLSISLTSTHTYILLIRDLFVGLWTLQVDDMSEKATIR